MPSDLTLHTQQNLCSTDSPFSLENINLQGNILEVPRDITLIQDICFGSSPHVNMSSLSRHGTGRTLERIQSSFASQYHLRQFDISIDTPNYSHHGSSNKTIKQNALQSGFISQEHVENNSVIKFHLPAQIGNFRTELAHHNKLGMHVDSSYSFKMKVGQAANDVIFFQVREPGGLMKTMGKDRPPISLHLIEGKKIKIVVNSIYGQETNKAIAILACPDAWNQFQIKVTWDKTKPFVELLINGKSMFSTSCPFGSSTSKNHYSKFGVYIPNQKKVEGLRSTSLYFDNVREVHRQYISSQTGKHRHHH